MIIFTDKETYFIRRIKEEAEKINFPLQIVDPNFISIYSDLMKYNGEDVLLRDVIYFRGSIFKEKREKILSISEFCKFRGAKIINSAESSFISSNKWLCRLYLTKNNIKMPKACLIFDKKDVEEAVNFLGGFPLLLKTFYGSKGSGVIFINDIYSLISVYDYFSALEQNFYLEEFIDSPQKQTIRTICMNKKAICSFIMTPQKDDFRSNYAKGGNAIITDDKTEKIAVDVMKLCKLDFCAVDMIQDKNTGEYFVLEVNSSPGIEMAEKITGKNIAKQFITINW